MAINTFADLSTTPSSNVDLLSQNATGNADANTIDTLIQNFAAMTARFYGDIGGLGTVGGSANAVTLTSLSTYQALESGLFVAFKAASANTGAATLNLDGLGAKAIRKPGDVALSAGEIAANGHYLVVYDEAYNTAAGAWVLLNPSIPANTYQPYNATLPKFRLQFSPLANEPPTSNYATLDLRNNHPVLDFDTTTQETAIFSGVVPSLYDNSSGFTVDVYAAMSSATSGTLGWDVAFESLASQDIDSDGFASAKTITATTVPGTSGQLLKLSVAFAHSEIDGLTAGDAFRIRLRRDVSNDTATGDAELVALVVRQT
jgi:hypothetical protein